MTNLDNNLIIHGCGGHARSVADMALQNGFDNLIFVDGNARENETLFEFKVIPTLDYENDFYTNFFIGIGDNYQRAALFDLLAISNTNLITLKAKSSYQGKNSKINNAVFIGQNTYVGPEVHIDDNTIINTRSIIEHDCIVGKHCHIAINATIAGKCHIGDFVMIGAGAVVIDKISICSNVIVGAGAVVVEDIKEPGTYVGVPARKLLSK